VLSSYAGGRITVDEIRCEEHFRQMHHRNGTGRYVLRLAFKRKPHTFGESRAIAERTLNGMLRRFQRDPVLKSRYEEFLEEYEDLWHIEVYEGTDASDSYYLPHHGVLKKSSTTTKLRVVFNGSQETALGLSLNDSLHLGPKIQQELVDVILRWRIPGYVFTSDVEKCIDK